MAAKYKQTCQWKKGDKRVDFFQKGGGRGEMIRKVAMIGLKESICRLHHNLIVRITSPHPLHPFIHPYPHTDTSLRSISPLSPPFNEGVE